MGKKRLNKTIIILMLVLLLFLSTFYACENRNREISGRITEAGSTTVLPLAQKLAEAFMSRYPNVTILTHGGGSGHGIKAAADGAVDIGASSREIESNDPQLVKHLIGQDGIAVIVHPSNPINGVSLPEITRIFSGEIRNWDTVGGNNQSIAVVIRQLGSGTGKSFEEMVMKEAAVTANAIQEPSNEGIRSFVSTHPDAIGYLSFSYLDGSTKALSVNGIAAELKNCRSGEYPIVRPLYFLTRSDPSDLVTKFIDFSLSAKAQKIVASEGYIAMK